MYVTGIKYTGPVFDSSGYGRACRGNILALHNAGVPIRINPITFERKHPDLGKHGKVLQSLINKDIGYNVNIVHTTPEFWSKHKESSKCNIGYTIWETTKLHPDWPEYINSNVDKVLVGCEWNKKVFSESGVTIPIGVVPHGVDTSEFVGATPFNIGGVKETDYVFYSVFQWTERKHPAALIRAYYYAFTGVDDVVLVLKTYRNSFDDAEKQAIREIIGKIKSTMVLKHYPKIALVSDMLTEEQMAGLHARGNCYVSLDRGEGFGLGPFHAGAAGNPVIATGFGGTTEYAKEDNSYLVKYQLTPVFGMPWSPWYLGDQCWAEPDIIDGANLMHYVYTNREESSAKGLRLQYNIEKNFSWECIAKKIMKELEDI